MVGLTYCVCEKSKWTLTDFHYARCKTCKKWIPVNDVLEGWNKYFGEDENVMDREIQTEENC